MGPSPTYHPPKGEECETSVEHGLPLSAEPAVGYCSWRPRPSPMWGSCFVGAREVGPWVGEQKPLGKTPLRGNPSPEKTYLPTHLAFIFIMPPFAAISARYRAGEMVLVLHLLTISGFLRAPQLEHARTSPITVGRLVGSPLIVRRTTVENMRGPFTLVGGGLSHVLQMPTTAPPRVGLGLRQPPSGKPSQQGSPLAAACADIYPCGSHSPSPREFDQQIDQVIVRVRPRVPLGRLSAVLPCLGRNLPHEPQMRLCRPIGRGVHTLHELFQLRHEL